MKVLLTGSTGYIGKRLLPVLVNKGFEVVFAAVRGLKRYIRTVPVMTPRLSSYWLYFVTSTSYKLVTSLVDSMKVEVIARDS